MAKLVKNVNNRKKRKNHENCEKRLKHEKHKKVLKHEKHEKVLKDEKHEKVLKHAKSRKRKKKKMKITNKLVLKLLFEPRSKICQSLGYRNVSYIICKEIFLNTSTIDFELNTFILETFSCDLDNFRSFTL